MLSHYAKDSHNAESYLKFTEVSIGIGSIGAEVSHLRTSYQEAIRALDARFYIGNEKIVNYMDAIDEETEHSFLPVSA